MFDWLVVGAGFAGSVIAERLASQRDEKVLLIDRRPHIGGNAYDVYDRAGVLIHQYGPHIFHTNSQAVFDYLSQFTDWRPYEHRVLAEVDGMQVPIPINLTTINRLYGLSLTSAELEGWFAARAEPVAEIRTAEDVVVSTVGRELYEKFFRGYTRKQWGVDPSELDKAVTARVPTRTNTDDRYFGDKYQYHAQGRLHQDVRADARSPEHQDHARYRLPRHQGCGTVPAGHLHRPDRRIFRLSLRADCRTARCGSVTSRWTRAGINPSPS